MQLKNYQLNTLSVLKRFFEQCRMVGPKEAFTKIMAEPDLAARLVSVKAEYQTWSTIPKTPRVCLKIPTGGGKTILAAHAMKIVGETWCEKEHPLVLWFVPTDTIRRQTAEALKNKCHPYRWNRILPKCPLPAFPAWNKKKQMTAPNIHLPICYIIIAP